MKVILYEEGVIIIKLRFVKCMLAPQKVLIGNVNPKLERFNDSPALLKCGGYKKINAVRVFYTDKYVRGFEIFYKLNDGDLLKAGHNTPKKRKELKNAVFEIGPDDYLSEIQGALAVDGKKNRIVNITFLTYRGKAATFGGQGPQQFAYSFPGFTFGAFSGGFKKQIEYLEVEVLPLPEEFKKEMEKIHINVIIHPQAPAVENKPKIETFAKVQMPTIPVGVFNIQHQQQPPQRQSVPSCDVTRTNSDSFQTPQPAASNPVNTMTSSKYPTFGSPQPQNQFGGAPQYNQYPHPYTAQPLYPGNNTYQFPQYNYPGQMNINPYQQKPQ